MEAIHLGRGLYRLAYSSQQPQEYRSKIPRKKIRTHLWLSWIGMGLAAAQSLRTGLQPFRQLPEHPHPAWHIGKVTALQLHLL